MVSVEHLIPEHPDPLVSAVLFAILALVLILPFRVKKIEENLEPFFLVMGIIAVLATNTLAPILTAELIIHALESPVGIVKIGEFPVLGIFQVVLIMGLIIHFYNRQIYTALVSMMRRVGLRAFTFFFVVFFGLISSIISVIVCSVILAEIALAMPLERRKKIEFIVIACFAIPAYTESLRTVGVRAVRVYIFIAALELLGAGCTPLIVWYISKVPPEALYWINTVSAFLDNATLTAAEISPALTEFQVKSAIMGLIISGGMLIPGNIPNIVAAARMKITMTEWAKIGVPLGAVIMAVYFVLIYLVMI